MIQAAMEKLGLTVEMAERMLSLSTTHIDSSTVDEESLASIIGPVLFRLHWERFDQMVREKTSGVTMKLQYVMEVALNSDRKLL
jgi:hypothetical protein